MYRWNTRLLIPLVAVGFSAARAHGEFETPTAITNVTIVTGTGSTIESGTIVFSKGRFVAVGGELDIPPHAERIDGTGLIAYPGFIDAHTRLGIPKNERTQEEPWRLR